MALFLLVGLANAQLAVKLVDNQRTSPFDAYAILEVTTPNVLTSSSLTKSNFNFSFDRITATNTKLSTLKQDDLGVKTLILIDVNKTELTSETRMRPALVSSEICPNKTRDDCYNITVMGEERYDYQYYRNYTAKEWVSMSSVLLKPASKYLVKLESNILKQGINYDWILNAEGVSYKQWAWWNGTWPYSRSVSLNSTVATNLTNFSAYFIMDTATPIAAGKMLANCTDLRMVNSSEDGTLDYYIENQTCNTNYTAIYMRIPLFLGSIGAGGVNYTAYVYYGNTSAVSDQQNGANAFASYNVVNLFSNMSGGTITAVKGASFAASGANRGVVQSAGCLRGLCVNMTPMATESYNLTANTNLTNVMFGDYGSFTLVFSQSEANGVNKVYYSKGGTYFMGSTDSPATIVYNFNDYTGGGGGYTKLYNPVSYRPMFSQATIALTASTSKIGDKSATAMRLNSSSGTSASKPDSAFKLTVAATAYLIDEYRYSQTVFSNDWFIAEINQSYTIGDETSTYAMFSVNATLGGTASSNSSLIWSVPSYITINATKNSGYLFLNWTTNCTGTIEHPTNPINQIYITANKTCYAQANFYATSGTAGNCTAVGGTITTDGAFTVHRYTSNNTFNITGTINNMTVLVVAGGGGGGRYYSGGGGAGGLLYNTSYLNAVGNNTVTIGIGGAVCTTSAGCTGSDGQSSVFGVMTVTGGGGGAGSSAGGAAGRAGGSGGGAGGTGAASGGTATPSGQGNAGGATSGSGGAGGGGAGGVGTTKTAGGTGGIGTNYSINGSSFCYAGGGGGSMGTPGQATCGGGKGATDAAAAVAGTANTGGGGGGGSSPQAAGAGGSGVVVVRYNTTGCVQYPATGSLTVNYTAGGTATGDNYTFYPPANLSITATVAAGYEFFNWTTNCNGTFASATSANTTIQINDATACFVQANFVLTIVSIAFVSQIPSDINITNVINSPVKITYNITGNNLNTSTIRLFYKANSTADNTMFWLNGTAFSGYFDDSYSLTPRTNVSTNYTWTLLDNEIYPGTYNTGPVSIDNIAHTKVTLGNKNSYIWTEFYNVSGTKQWGYYEIMANSTVGANPSSVYYCNSTYTTGDVSTNANCALISTRTATSAFDHCHTNASCHIGFQFAINTTAQTIGSVKVTSISYFVFGKSKNWNYFTIAGIVRPSMQKTTVNKGISWTVDNTAIVDTHLHQFDNSENQTFHYYACANDTSGNETCSSVRTDLMEMGGLPPSSPDVYSPVEDSVYTLGDTININYTASLSPNAYNISFYNLSLLNSDFTFNKTIYTNNSLNLSYAWNTSVIVAGAYGIVAGSYLVGVEAKDVINQASMGYSGQFNITLGAVCTINTTYVYNVTNNYTIMNFGGLSMKNGIILPGVVHK